MKKPPKAEMIVERVRAAVIERRIRFSEHANEQMIARDINQLEVWQVLLRGFHEAKKDEFKNQAWRYAIRGKTNDGKNLRIPVVFELPGVIVVTAIDLDREQEA